MNSLKSTCICFSVSSGAEAFRGNLSHEKNTMSSAGPLLLSSEEPPSSAKKCPGCISEMPKPLPCLFCRVGPKLAPGHGAPAISSLRPLTRTPSPPYPTPALLRTGTQAGKWQSGANSAPRLASLVEEPGGAISLPLPSWQERVHPACPCPLALCRGCLGTLGAASGRE